jgi:hypothetical protein
MMYTLIYVFPIGTFDRKTFEINLRHDFHTAGHSNLLYMMGPKMDQPEAASVSVPNNKTFEQFLSANGKYVIIETKNINVELFEVCRFVSLQRRMGHKRPTI